MILKKVSLIATLLFGVAVCFTACKKDEQVTPPTQANVVRTGSQIENKEGVTVLYDGSKKKTKGYIADTPAEAGVEVGDVYDANTGTVMYKAIKVVRSNGRFFWIMVDNLKSYVTTGCYSYNDAAANIANYGRLYTWDAAKSAASTAYMKMKKINPNTLAEYGPTLKFSGRLPNMQDLYDLFEMNQTGRADDTNGTYYYYDFFVAGLTPIGTNWISGSNHSRAGWRDNTSYNPPYVGNPYKWINTMGKFWLAVTDPGGYPRPLQIGDGTTMTSGVALSCFVQNGYDPNFGFSVRYVFEPVYQ